MEFIKSMLRSKQCHILLLTGFGVLLLAASFSPGGSSSFGRTGPKSWGASVDPLPLAIGAVSLVSAWLIYRKWSSRL